MAESEASDSSHKYVPGSEISGSSRKYVPSSEISGNSHKYVPGSEISGSSRKYVPGSKISGRSRKYVPGSDSDNSHKFVPGSEAQPEEIFNFPFLMDEKTMEFIRNHGRIMFIIRGPPGTGKKTLSSMICTKYSEKPKAVVCSADEYFSQAFVSKLRNKETLTKSHEFCQKRVKEECERDTHPIVVQNTHIKRWELKEYLDIAAKYGYTIIMAITLRKFIADPKVLAQTNKKGLNEDYLKSRVSQWQENIPLYIGWFLCPDDEDFVIEKTKNVLDNLLGDGKFCKEFDTFCKDEIWNYFKVEDQLFCIATYCGHGKERGTYRFYLSNIVQNVYGKSFTLSIQGFVVTPNLVLAVVTVTEDMKILIQKQFNNSNTGNEDLLSFALDALSILDTRRRGNCTFQKDFSSNGKTAKLQDCLEGELMNINYMSFISIAYAGRKNVIKDMNKFAMELFSEVTNEQGIIEDLMFSELDNGTRYCRLPNNAWLIKLKQKITLSTVLTGLYTT